MSDTNVKIEIGLKIIPTGCYFAVFREMSTTLLSRLGGRWLILESVKEKTQVIGCGQLRRLPGTKNAFYLDTRSSWWWSPKSSSSQF